MARSIIEADGRVTSAQFRAVEKGLTGLEFGFLELLTPTRLVTYGRPMATLDGMELVYGK